MSKCVSVDEYRPGFFKVKIHAKFDTIAEAEAWIAKREEIDPEGVHAGFYGINAPEDMINP